MDASKEQYRSAKASTNLKESMEEEREKLYILAKKYGINHSITYQQSCLIDILVLKVLQS